MWAFIVIAAVYLVIVQGVSKLLTAGQHAAYAAPTSVNELWRSITVPVLVSLVFVYAVVGVLGWWRPVFTDDRPVRRWVWVIPVIIAVTAPAGIELELQMPSSCFSRCPRWGSDSPRRAWSAVEWRATFARLRWQQWT